MDHIRVCVHSQLLHSQHKMAAGGSGLALLLKVKEAYKRGSVQLGAVEEALATEPFSSGAGLHATTDNGVGVSLCVCVCV